MASGRGVVLLNVLILLLIMVFVAGAMLQLAMGRTEMVARHRSSFDSKQVTESVRTLLETCLANATYPPSGSCPCPTCTSGFSAWGRVRCPALPAVTNGCTGYETSATLQPISPGLTYAMSACWCDPGDPTYHGAMAITCTGSCGGCGCP